jgi:catechol 2,3-dioxygenase-like lactoylglutathione lyase family enzyme
MWLRFSASWQINARAIHIHSKGPQNMTLSISLFSYLVDDYDRAIQYFTGVLGFELVEDTDRGGDKRWVVVAPERNSSPRLLIAQAVGERQIGAIGNQFGGRVGLFLETDDFNKTYKKLLANGINFTEEPRHESYGTVAVFEDLYDTRWDLIEYAK